MIVNRVWQHHFGRGIVDTPNDFGYLGSPPSHPELLEWLADELVRNNWQLKPLHRLIMHSATYRQSVSDKWVELDHDNKGLWHYRARRMEGEIIRDNLLSVSGALRHELYGPSIEVGSDKRPYKEKSEHWRRSIYLMSPRFATHPVLRVFDPPNTFQSSGDRVVSTTPAGALFMFNSKFVRNQAHLFANRVRREAGEQETARVKWVYRIAFSRLPTDSEISAGVKFMRQAANESGSHSRALDQYCHAIMGLNEFIYVR